MPQPTIWDQYAVVAILFTVICVLGYAFYRAFVLYHRWTTEEAATLRAWQEDQFGRRETEAKIQRDWYEQMEKKREEALTQRDRQWQQFMREIQDIQDKRERESAEILSRLVSRIETLNETFAMHHQQTTVVIEQLVRGNHAKRSSARQ